MELFSNFTDAFRCFLENGGSLTPVPGGFQVRYTWDPEFPENTARCLRENGISEFDIKEILGDYE